MVAILALSLAAPSIVQDGSSVINSALKAMGAEDLRTIEFSGTGYDFVLGQAYNPTSPRPKFINRTYTQTIDFRVPAWRIDRIRAQGENPARGGGGQPSQGDQTISQTLVVTPDTPWDQQLEILLTPYGFLNAAAANSASARTQTIRGKRYNVLTFTGGNTAQVNGYINDQHLVERVETSPWPS